LLLGSDSSSPAIAGTGPSLSALAVAALIRFVPHRQRNSEICATVFSRLRIARERIEVITA
jgi:hypothetical protein